MAFRMNAFYESALLLCVKHRSFRCRGTQQNGGQSDSPGERVASEPAEPVSAPRPICLHAAPPPSAAPSPPARLPKTCKRLEVAEAGRAESSWGAVGLKHAPRDPCGCAEDAWGQLGLLRKICFAKKHPMVL